MAVGTKYPDIPEDRRKEIVKANRRKAALKNLEKARETNKKLNQSLDYINSLTADVNELADTTKKILDNLSGDIRQQVHFAIEQELRNRDISRLIAFDMFKTYAEAGGASRLKNIIKKDPKAFMKFLDLLIKTVNSTNTKDVGGSGKGVKVVIEGLNPDGKVTING